MFDSFDAFQSPPSESAPAGESAPAVESVPEAFECADESLLSQLFQTEIDRGALYLEQARILTDIAGMERFTQNVIVEGDRAVRIDDGIREQIAVHMRWSFAATQNRIDHARLLMGPLGETSAALAQGRITVEHATTIARAADRLSLAWSTQAGDLAAFEAHCAELQQSVLPVAYKQTVSRAVKAAERALERIDAQGQKAKRRNQAKFEEVSVIDEGNGRAVLLARMGILEAQACMSAVRARAEAAEFTELRDVDGQPLPAGQRRIRALIASLIARGPSAHGPSDSHVEAHVDIVIDLPTLLGLQDSMALSSVGNRAPVLVSGIDVREFLDSIGGIKLRRLVCDPLTGHLVDLGRKRYVPSARLREFITSRDVTCRFPGCERSARNGQIDHAREWNRGGTTGRSNLGALCIRHHQLKTHGGWQITQSHIDGSCTWRSPSGREYPHAPHDFREDLPPPF